MNISIWWTKAWVETVPGVCSWPHQQDRKKAKMQLHHSHQLQQVPNQLQQKQDRKKGGNSKELRYEIKMNIWGACDAICHQKLCYVLKAHPDTHVSKPYHPVIHSHIQHVSSGCLSQAHLKVHWCHRKQTKCPKNQRCDHVLPDLQILPHLVITAKCSQTVDA